MNVRFPAVEQIVAIHQANIQEFGGAPGLRDPGLLESAVLRAEQKFHYSPDSSIASLAAALSWGLIKNHAFIDGNKRIGLASLLLFLEANGHTLAGSETETRDAILRAAASEVLEDEWTAWVERNAIPKVR